MAKDVLFEEEKKENPVLKFFKENWFETGLLCITGIACFGVCKTYKKSLNKPKANVSGIASDMSRLVVDGAYTQGKLDAYREMSQIKIPEVK